ncbi:ribonuclease H-like domain-containing protein [Tanacetum coccineum]
MVTLFHVESNRPLEHPNLHVSSISPILKSYTDAFNDPNWHNDMCDEYNALIKNKLRLLCPSPQTPNIVRCMWLFRQKYLEDGTLSRYKARLVANGSTQIEGIVVDETFSLIVKSGAIRTFLSFDTSPHWPVHQLNVKNAFLHGDLSETIYMKQPPGFQDYAHPDYRKYDVEILKREHMFKCNSSQTPVDTESKIADDGDLVSDPALYQSLVGSLQYLTFTRPDISYAVHQICLYMHDPQEPYLSALKWILRYVRGTLDYGLQLFSSSTTSLVAYSDTVWVGCPTTSDRLSIIMSFWQQLTLLVL